MKLAEFYQSGRFGLSFELFPPKTAAKEAELFLHVAELMRFRPDFITCTYGAGGSTRAKTLEIIQRVKAESQIPVATHLTCVGSTRDDLRDYLRTAGRQGVDFVVALRGDPPKGESEFRPVDGGLSYACDLVELIKSEFPDFGIAVAGYPETHREATSPAADLANLKCKVDAGADVVITQLFYDNDDFFAFRDKCEGMGIRVPIIPGVLPITNLAQVQRITSLCGAKLPLGLVTKLTAAGADAERQFDVGIEFAIAQVQGLIDAGVPGIHFYVLNQSQATRKLLPALDLPDGSVASK